MTGTSIIGWSHLPFGKHADKDIESMMVEAGAGALKHAGVAPKDVDAIFVGHFNAGFSPQDFPSSLSFGIDPALRFKPATRVRMPAPPAPPPFTKVSRRSPPSRRASCW